MTNRRDAFTLIELTIVLVVLAVISAVAIPRIGMMLEASKKAATLQEMEALKRAIVGDPRVTAGGQLVNVGYEGDVGSLPPDLQALVTKPGSVPAWNRFTRVGWNGPYIDDEGNDYLTDAWGSAYQYDAGARTITSSGGSETLVITF
jgi:prepilin-type N-terminal cleavage/methylation domain-containing protein